MDELFNGLTEQEKRDAVSKFLLARIDGPNRPHPLAYSQESRWTLTVSTAHAAVENHTFAWRLRSAVDAQALRAAVQALLESHACLRSVFGTYEGRTVRYVQQEFTAPFEVHDRVHSTHAEITAETRREVAAPFDLRTGPVLRVKLFQTSPDEHILVLTAHHILADFWSLAIALRKLAEFYLMTAGSLPVNPTGDDNDFDEFVLWEARRVLGPPGKEALNYWGRQFAGGLDFVELPADRPWPATRGFHDAEHRFTMPERHVERLRRLGQQHDCTLFVVMLALFYVLIYTYTRQSSIAVISPVSTRSRLGFENQVGALSNHLLLRARPGEHMQFGDFLKQVRECVVGAMEHRDFPISLVTRRVHVRGVPTGAVPFPLKFNMPKAPMLKGELAQAPEQTSRLTVALGAFNAELEVLDRRVTGNSELNLGVIEVPGGLLGTLQYNVELFDETSIREMVARLSHIGEIVSSNGKVSLGDMAQVCTSMRS